MAEPGFWKRVRRGYSAAAILWTNTCVLLLLLEVGAALVLAWRDGASGPDAGEPVERALNRIYADWPPEDRERLQAESRHGFVPEGLVQYREAARSGRFVEIDPNGFRVGRNQGPWPPDPASYNVFLLGGSTALGYGVPDEETISSHLQAILEEAGLPRPPRLYNFARGSFYSTQERMLFDRLATLGPRPDAVIFLDGLNDFFFSSDPPPLTAFWTRRGNEILQHPGRAALQDLAMVRAFSAAGPRHALAELAGEERGRGTGPLGDEPRADAVIRRYRQNVAIARAIAAAHDIRSVFVWQPVPTYGYDLRHHVFDGHFGRHELARVGYPRFREQLAGAPVGRDFVWCAEIQRDARELLYVDRVHYSPEMSRKVAQCIAAGILEQGLLP